MALCTALESTLHAILPAIRVPMLFVGSGYMLYLARKTVKEPVSMEKKDAGGGFLSGCLLQFINPKIYFYCIVSMETYILPFYEGNVPALLGFSLLLSTIGFLFTVVLCAVWLAVRKGLFPIRESGELGTGAAAGVLRGIAVPVTENNLKVFGF